MNPESNRFSASGSSPGGRTTPALTGKHSGYAQFRQSCHIGRMLTRGSLYPEGKGANVTQTNLDMK